VNWRLGSVAALRSDLNGSVAPVIAFSCFPGRGARALAGLRVYLQKPDLHYDDFVAALKEAGFEPAQCKALVGRSWRTPQRQSIHSGSKAEGMNQTTPVLLRVKCRLKAFRRPGALHCILDVKGGEILALVGEKRRGKSTLIHILAARITGCGQDLPRQEEVRSTARRRRSAQASAWCSRN